jgi:tRNA(Ile)-lysidine synthase
MTEWEMTVDGRVLLTRADLSPTLLSAALLCAAGTDRPPRSLQLDRLLDRLNGDRPVDATLAGARLVAAGETVQIGRDAGERFRGGLTPIPLAVGTPTVWDGRFEIVADAPGLGVGPLGGAMGRLPPAERNSLKAFPAWARGALPALTDDTGGARLPRPWGQGPAEVHGLAAARLTAFLGGADDERSLARQADAVDSAASFRLS